MKRERCENCIRKYYENLLTFILLGFLGGFLQTIDTLNFYLPPFKKSISTLIDTLGHSPDTFVAAEPGILSQNIFFSRL